MITYLLGLGCIWSSFGGMRGTLLQSKVELVNVPSAWTCQLVIELSTNPYYTAENGVGRTLRTEELSRDVQSLASHDDNLLAIQ